MATSFFRRRRSNRHAAVAASVVPPAPSRPAPPVVAIATAEPLRAEDLPPQTAVPARPVPHVETRPFQYTCHACRMPISRAEGHVHTRRPLSGERRYHRQCFTCHHCGLAIDPSVDSFCYSKRKATGNNGGNGHSGEAEYPFHRKCYSEHFGWVCVVCDEPLPMVSKSSAGKRSTKVEFLKHPFFDTERMCPRHVQSSSSNSNTRVTLLSDTQRTTMSEECMGDIRRCAGCHRFEPRAPAKRFIDINDNGRCVCLACCRTVVTTNEDASPLWDKVLDFFEGPLGLITSEASAPGGVTRRQLKDIPVLIVGHEALNENISKQPGSNHAGSTLMTRGLCLSEHQRGGRRGKQGTGDVEVTAVLCLSGLPSDLTASILAHEATHAWIKLHPNFPYNDPLPLKVEEGLAQLVAFLFLNDGLDAIVEETPTSADGEDSNGSDSIPTNARLRQYFRFCIETDEGVYGEGFRLAARGYASMGIQELLYYVALHRDFPPL